MTAEQQQLVIDNLGLAYHVSRRFHAAYGGERDEWDAEARYWLVRAASNYDPSKMLFAGYAATIIRQGLEKVLRSWRRWARNRPSDLEPKQVRPVFEVVDDRESVSRVLALATPQQREFCQLRMKGLGTVEIAESCGVSRWHVAEAFANLRNRLARRVQTTPASAVPVAA